MILTKMNFHLSYESLEENDVRTPNQGRSQILINNDNC